MSILPTPEMLLNYPAENLELTPEEEKFILEKMPKISDFFGFNVWGLDFVELLSISAGVFLNKFRDLNESETRLHKVSNPETTIFDIKILKHNHYNRMLNLGKGFLAIKSFDPDPVYHSINNMIIPHKKNGYFIIDPYDNVLSPNNSKVNKHDIGSFEMFMQIDLAIKQMQSLRKTDLQ
jgi:hypothetical protein